ncbi:hypothetical protein [Peribacillus sp. SCS-155]|uniref:hypothetical protein n=1 Tax=Peribacillus sedimenti TaxID=3115297 RepID=UPI003905F4B7
MKKIQLATLYIILAIILSGCMYPKEQKAENQVPYKAQIQSVQNAVEQFQKEEGGILPIKTKPGDTPYYQKHLVDFSKIAPRYMAEPPGNAYESGGVFQYVIIDEETNPKVKIFDIRLAQQLQDYNLRVMAYRQNNGYPPFKERLADTVFTLDYKKLGLKDAPVVRSPYSDNMLHIVVNNEAEAFIDYTPDLMKALKKTKHQFKPGEDIRRLLTESSDFVPAYSLPYTVDEKTKMPVFLIK